MSAAMSGTTRNVVSLDATRNVVSLDATRNVVSLDSIRNVVSLDSSSSSSGSLSMESVMATNATLGHLPFAAFAEIYRDQQRMRRELDYMFEQVDGMQVKLDRLFVEVAALKKRRT